MKICEKVVLSVEQTLLETGSLQMTSHCLFTVSDYKQWLNYREQTIPCLLLDHMLVDIYHLIKYVMERYFNTSTHHQFTYSSRT